MASTLQGRSLSCDLLSPDTYNAAVELHAVESEEKTPNGKRVSSDEETTDLPFTAERSRRPNTSKPTGKHNVFYTFPQRSEL